MTWLSQHIPAVEAAVLAAGTFVTSVTFHWWGGGGPLEIVTLVAVTLLAPSALFLARRARRERQHRLELSDFHDAAVEALARAIEAQEPELGRHSRRVQWYAVSLARAQRMGEEDVQSVAAAALLHDIGKLGVPSSILLKPGPLTQLEVCEMRTHTDRGVAILSDLPLQYQITPLIVGHHERWDGGGYPRGLRGEQIPLGARIVAVADYFDAITSDRPYRSAMPLDMAVEAIRNEGGRALDPLLVKAFLGLLPTPAPLAEGSVETARPELLRAFPVQPVPVPASYAGAQHAAIDSSPDADDDWNGLLDARPHYAPHALRPVDVWNAASQASTHSPR